VQSVVKRILLHVIWSDKNEAKEKNMPESWTFLCGKKACKAGDYILVPLGLISFFLAIWICAALIHNINRFNVCNPIPTYGTYVLGLILGVGLLIYALLVRKMKGLMIFSLLIGILLIVWNLLMWFVRPCAQNQNFKSTRALAWFDLSMWILVILLIMKLD
jgi:hypothetical protein